MPTLVFPKHSPFLPNCPQPLISTPHISAHTLLGFFIGHTPWRAELPQPGVEAASPAVKCSVSAPRPPGETSARTFLSWGSDQMLESSAPLFLAGWSRLWLVLRGGPGRSPPSYAQEGTECRDLPLVPTAEKSPPPACSWSPRTQFLAREHGDSPARGSTPMRPAGTWPCLGERSGPWCGLGPLPGRRFSHQ